jgi:hypothetical protein
MGSKCSHKVCEVEDRQHTCMIRSGEVLREYSDHSGNVWWAVERAILGKQRHSVTAWDVSYGKTQGRVMLKGLMKMRELVQDFMNAKVNVTLQVYADGKAAALWVEYLHRCEQSRIVYPRTKVAE